MARAAGVSHSTVQRIWDEHGVQPRRATPSRLSADPTFGEELTDIVGLYLSPLDKVAVLCVDEKCQIAALDRTRGDLPTKPGCAGTMNPGCECGDTTTLLAALNALAGRIVGECHGRQRRQVFLRFLRRLDRAFPGGLMLHVIADNHGVHNREPVRKWLTGHPRFRLHCTPTGASWLYLVESWFSGVTQQRRRGAFCSVRELVAAIEDHSTHHDADTGPFVWSTTVDAVLDRVRGGGATPETRG